MLVQPTRMAAPPRLGGHHDAVDVEKRRLARQEEAMIGPVSRGSLAEHDHERGAVVDDERVLGGGDEADQAVEGELVDLGGVGVVEGEDGVEIGLREGTNHDAATGGSREIAPPTIVAGP